MKRGNQEPRKWGAKLVTVGERLETLIINGPGTDTIICVSLTNLLLISEFLYLLSLEFTVYF